MNRSEYHRHTHIAGAATTVVKSGRGALGILTVNAAVASSTITLYDNTAGSGTVIAIITNPGTLNSNQYVLPYFVQFTNGLTIVTSGADDLTVSWI